MTPPRGPGRPGPSGRSGRPGRPGRPERPERPEQPERPERPERRERPDLRLVLPAAAGWAGAWCALGLPARPVLAAAAGVLLLLLVLLPLLLPLPRHPARAAPRGRRPVPAAALVAAASLACAAGGAAAAAVRVDAVRDGPVARLAALRPAVDAVLVVTADPQRRPAGPSRPDLLLVPARAEQVVARGTAVRTRTPVLVLAEDPAWLRLLPGQRVRAEGRLGPARPGDAQAGVLSVRGAPTAVEDPGTVQSVAGELRDGLREAVSGLPERERGLVPGLVVGDTSALPADLEEDFRTAGLTHLVAVSGANCAIVLGAVLLAARWAGVRGRALPVLGALALLGFLVLARPQPSVLRATVMGLVAVAALASGRRRLGVPALCAAALGLVLVDPWLARSYGYALSVVATAGLLVLAGPLTRRLERRLPRWLAAAVAVPVAAQAVCGPIVVLLASQVSLVAVPANLLVAPAVAPATVLGVLAAVLAPLGELPAAVAGELAGLPARWIVAVATRAADVPGAAVPWPGGLRGALLLAAVTAAAAVLVARARRPGARRSLPRPTVVVLGTAVLLVTVPPAATRRDAWPPPGWAVVACDVGQGDALVLAAGPGEAVVVDAGPEPEAVDRCLRDLGVRRVAALVLTHLHADHVDGLAGVLRRPVGEVVVGPLQEPAAGPAAVRRLQGALAEAGVPLRSAATGERSAYGDVVWDVLGPDGVVDEGSAANDSSLVLSVRVGGVTALLTGDVEPAGQLRLLRRLDADADGMADAGPYDVLKVPHHGSAKQLPALFAAASARLGLVSVGAGNDYGHPAPSVLRLLAATRTVVARTDEQGDVAVVGPTQRLRVQGRR